MREKEKGRQRKSGEELHIPGEKWFLEIFD